MTVVPASFQLASWIPAWWRGSVGGDDLLGLTDPGVLEVLRELQDTTVVCTAFCRDAGVDLLPGPKPGTESAVAAGEAVLLHAVHGEHGHMLVPSPSGWQIHRTAPARPFNLDVQAATTLMTEAVLVAEQQIRDADIGFDVPERNTRMRPLPPDADPARIRLASRAVRLWAATTAIPAARRTEALSNVLRCAARATLAAYSQADLVAAGSRQRRLV